MGQRTQALGRKLHLSGVTSFFCHLQPIPNKKSTKKRKKKNRKWLKEEELNRSCRSSSSSFHGI